MGKIATLSHEKICIMQVVIVLWSAFSSKHSAYVYSGPKFSIFSELNCLIDTSSIYGKHLTQENSQKSGEGL